MDKPITIPPPIKLEECVIDLDFDVFEWKDSVQSKLFALGTCRTEKDLVRVMQSYVEAIRKDYFSLVQEAAVIKKFIPRHVLFFRNTLNTIKCITFDNYLDTMEDILGFYINLEIAGVPQKKGNQDKAFKRYLLNSYRQILYVLKLGLMSYEDDRKYHVLMKMDINFNNNSDYIKYYLNFLYRKMLTECPKNKSDLAFCRIYILYQKWKKIRDPSEWPMMDVVMYKMFDRTPQYVENSDVLKKILLCKNNSILNVLNHISNHHVVLTKEYFKYLKTLTYDEEEMMSFDREDNIIKKKEVDPYDEEEDTERAYQDYLEWLAKPSEPPEQTVQVPTTNKSSPQTSTVGEIESDDDDDVQFVKAEVLPIICEIPDDDDLCDIVYIEKMPLPIVKKEKEINFLDSIDISEYDKIRDRYRNQRKTVSSNVPLQSNAETTNIISTNTDSREIDSSNNPIVEIPNDDGGSATQTKNFVNMETQTEPSEFSDKLDDFNKNFGGLVTPPGSVSNDTLNLEKEIEQQSQVNVSTSGVTEEQQCKASNTVVTTSDESVNCKKEIVNSTPNGIRRKTIFQSRDLEDYDNFDPIGEMSKNVVKNVETSDTHGSELPIESTSSPSSTSNLNHLTKCFNESCTSLASPIISSTSIDAQDNLAISNINENILESCDSNIDFYSEEYNKSPEEAIHVSQSDLAVDHDSNLDESNQITGQIDENIEETQHSNDLNVANITTDILVERQLETNKEKVDVPKKKTIEESSPRAIYTSERKDIFLNNTIECDPVIQLQAGFQDSDFNNIFSGPVEKPKAPSDYIIPDKSFDLFENKTISKTPNPETSKNVSAVVTQNVEISSPTYEGIEEEDVRNFFQKKSYETIPTSTTTTNYNNTKLIRSKCEMLTSTTDEITFNAHNIIDKTVVNDTTLETSKDNDFDELRNAKPKKKRILFADEELEVYTPTPPSVLKINGALHGILKKTPSLIKKTTRPRVPRKCINLQSFKENHVHPMDIKVQSELYVKVPKISEEELDHFLRLAEAARESQKKVEEQHSRIYMIEYDKNSSNINNSDMVLYRGRNIPLPSITQYRLQTFEKVDQEEGRISPFANFTDNDLTDNSHQCLKDCCSDLNFRISNVHISKKKLSKISHALSNSLPCLERNPFYLKPKSKNKKKRKDSAETIINNNVPEYFLTSNNNASPNVNIDLSFVNSIVENFEKESSDFILDLNPVNLEKVSNFDIKESCMVSPELETAIKPEDVSKISSIPPDLHNLNLRKFTPSPIMNCLSPHSASYIQNDCLVNEKNQICPLQEQTKNADFYDNLNVNCESTTPEISQSHLKPEPGIIPEECEAKDEIKTEEVTIPFNEKTKIEHFDHEEVETRLPLKKRKLSVANSKEEIDDDDFLGPDLVEEIIRRARAEQLDKEDISYPAKPMISIAEVQEKFSEPQPRLFKTPAEKKEMPPPPPPPPYQESPKIITEQYNNHTYNNPTINYHMNNVPYPFFPCASLSYFPPILLPINSTTTFDVNLAQQPQTQKQQVAQDYVVQNEKKPKKERKTRGKRRNL